MIEHYTPAELALTAKVIGVAAKDIEHICVLECAKCRYTHMCKDIIKISDTLLKTRDRYSKDGTAPTSKEILEYWEEMRKRGRKR